MLDTQTCFATPFYCWHKGNVKETLTFQAFLTNRFDSFWQLSIKLARRCQYVTPNCQLNFNINFSTVLFINLLLKTNSSSRVCKFMLCDLFWKKHYFLLALARRFCYFCICLVRDNRITMRGYLTFITRTLFLPFRSIISLSRGSEFCHRFLAYMLQMFSEMK